MCPKRDIYFCILINFFVILCSVYRTNKHVSFVFAYELLMSVISELHAWRITRHEKIDNLRQ